MFSSLPLLSNSKYKYTGEEYFKNLEPFKTREAQRVGAEDFVRKYQDIFNWILEQQQLLPDMDFTLYAFPNEEGVVYVEAISYAPTKEGFQYRKDIQAYSVYFPLIEPGYPGYF